MAISDTNETNLNKMNVYAQRVELGTVIQTAQEDIVTNAASTAAIIKGSHVVTSGEGTAETLDIISGLAVVTGWVIQIYRSDLLLTAQKVTEATGTLTIATNSTAYVMAEDDVINYIIY